MPLKAPEPGGASCLYRRAALVSGNTQDLLSLSEICPHHRRTLLHPHAPRPRAPLRPTTGFAPFSAKPTESASRPRWPASCPSGALPPRDSPGRSTNLPRGPPQMHAGARPPGADHASAALRAPLAKLHTMFTPQLTPDLSARPRAQGTSPPGGGLGVALGHFSSLPWGALGRSVEGAPGGPRKKAFPAFLAGCSPHVHSPGHHAPALRGAGRVPRTLGIPHPEQCQGPPVPQTPDVIPKHKLEPDVRAGPTPSHSPHVSEPVWLVPASSDSTATRGHRAEGPGPARPAEELCKHPPPTSPFSGAASPTGRLGKQRPSHPPPQGRQTVVSDAHPGPAASGRAARPAASAWARSRRQAVRVTGRPEERPGARASGRLQPHQEPGLLPCRRSPADEANEAACCLQKLPGLWGLISEGRAD